MLLSKPLLCMCLQATFDFPDRVLWGTTSQVLGCARAGNAPAGGSPELLCCCTAAAPCWESLAAKCHSPGIRSGSAAQCSGSVGSVIWP